MNIKNISTGFILLLVIILGACGNKEPTVGPAAVQVVPPTATFQVVPPTATFRAVPPTATFQAVPPTAGLQVQPTRAATAAQGVQGGNPNPAPTNAAPSGTQSDLTAPHAQNDVLRTFKDAQGRTIKLVYGRGNGRGGDYGWAHILGKHINGIWYDGGTITTFPNAIGVKNPEQVVDLINKSLQDKNPDDQQGGKRSYVYDVPTSSKDVFTVVGNDGTIITSYPVQHGSKDEG